MQEEDKLSTEAKILWAAQQEFLEKGFAGARTASIAQRAGINKALLHYYFRNKETLFEEVFSLISRQLIPEIKAIVTSEAPILDKIDRFIHSYIDFARQNPDMPLFVVTELRNNPDSKLLEILQKKQEDFVYIQQFMIQIAMATGSGEIRPVQPFHILLNILSMCVFPFMARPMAMRVMRLDEGQFAQLIEQRKQEVCSFVRQALVPG